MQELVLVQLGRRVEDEPEHQATRSDARREFEERLAECGPLAYRVARGVLRNTADAEDVAQEALLRAYKVSNGFATAADSVGGWFAFRFGLRWTGCAPRSAGSSATQL